MSLYYTVRTTTIYGQNLGLYTHGFIRLYIKGPCLYPGWLVMNSDQVITLVDTNLGGSDHSDQLTTMTTLTCHHKLSRKAPLIKSAPPESYSASILL